MRLVGFIIRIYHWCTVLCMSNSNWDFSLGVFRTLFICTEFRWKQNPDARQA